MDRQSAAWEFDPTATTWSDMYPDLLYMIAKRLSSIPLIAFRGACRSWRSAAAGCEAVVNRIPSLIVYDENKKEDKCLLYYRTDDGAVKKYKINIPELQNVNYLASNGGWLLLQQQDSIFFFCPFSRGRIDLPNFPESELSSGSPVVAAFSAPPTSPECIVSVAIRSSPATLNLYILRRGNPTWTKHERNIPPGTLGNIRAALYVEEKSSFYFVDNNRKLLRFSVQEATWTPYLIVHGPANPNVGILPFSYLENYFNAFNLRARMGLEEDVSVSICGALLPWQQRPIFACNEEIEAPNGNANSKLKAVWIESRFIHIPENQSWNL